MVDCLYDFANKHLFNPDNNEVNKVKFCKIPLIKAVAEDPGKFTSKTYVTYGLEGCLYTLDLSGSGSGDMSRDMSGDM